MARLLVKRILWGLLTLFLFQTVMFFVVNMIMPGDWATQFSQFLSAEQIAQMRADMGLDLPLWQQYLNWLRSFFGGHLGWSMSGSTVADVLKRVMPPTLMVFLPGTIIAFLIGQWLGKVVAWQSGAVTKLVTLSSIILYTSFPTWLAFMAIYFFGRRLTVLRNLLVPEHPVTLWEHAPAPPYRVIWIMLLTMAAIVGVLTLVHQVIKRFRKQGMPLLIAIPLFLVGWVLSWRALGLFEYTVDAAIHFALPTLVFILLSFGETMLIMRTNMMDTLKDEYINTARAKGVPERLVRDKHAARNALLPVLNRLVISLPYLLTGLVIIEHSFGLAYRSIGFRGIQTTSMTYEGMGWAFFMALTFQDTPVIMGTLFVVGVLSICARIVIDMLEAYLDPRIRFQG